MKLQVPNNQKTTIYNARLSFLYNTFCYTLKEVRKSLRSLLNCHSNYIQQYLITCPLNRTEMQKIAKSIIFINNFSGFKSHEYHITLGLLDISKKYKSNFNQHTVIFIFTARFE